MPWEPVRVSAMAARPSQRRRGAVGLQISHFTVFQVVDIPNQGGRIKLVQVYTIARNPAEQYATRLTNDQVDAIAQAVRSRTGLSVETYYGPS